MATEMIDSLIVRAEHLCRAIATLDLAGWPLYIVPQSRLPDELGGKAVCDGFTCPRLDLYLREVIGPAWQGRGPCMVIGDTGFEPLDALDAQCHLLAVVLHELAHILERPADADEDVDRAKLIFESLCVGHAVSQETLPDKTAPPFHGHGLRFIRAALHLQYRAKTTGVLVPLSGYCAGRQYGLSHPNRYRQALGKEPARLAGRPIRDILRASYPRAFRRLWAADVAHWLSCCSPSERSLCECPSRA